MESVEIKENIKEVNAALEKLKSRKPTKEIQREISECMLILGHLKVRELNIDEAITVFEEAYEILISMKDMTNDTLQLILMQLGLAYKIKGDHNNAIDCLEFCRKIWNRLNVLCPDSNLILEELASLYESRDGNNNHSVHIRKEMAEIADRAKEVGMELH